jgi:hypothetical protein
VLRGHKCCHNRWPGDGRTEEATIGLDFSKLGGARGEFPGRSRLAPQGEAELGLETDAHWAESDQPRRQIAKIRDTEEKPDKPGDA